ncbi:RsiV family protein [Mycolicibacterium austroafricanum]|uniref:RsiV family protein n=1 Tax=Mycolicibacterium austroafricanum TaxID=39687 RepID=UPI0011AEA6F0|nr:RsiV family protein [Mycolicibacterium austroafricanum]
MVTVSAVIAAPVAAGEPDRTCTAVLGGQWARGDGVCRGALTSERAATMDLSVRLPDDLLESPMAGAVITPYLSELVGGWRQIGKSMPRDSDYSADYQRFSRGPLTSVVFEERWQTVGAPPNRAYRTFTFDMVNGRQLQLADLFRPEVDPLTALPPLVRPFLIPALDQAAPPHDPGTYPFAAQEWEPQPDRSGYSGDYRAFAVTEDALVLYLPDAPMAHENPWPRDRFVWSMDGGTVTVRVPLTALASILAI